MDIETEDLTPLEDSVICSILSDINIKLLKVHHCSEMKCVKVTTLYLDNGVFVHF